MKTPCAVLDGKSCIEKSSAENLRRNRDLGFNPRKSQSHHRKFHRNGGGSDHSHSKPGVLHKRYGNSQELRPYRPFRAQDARMAPNLRLKSEAVHLRLVEIENDDSRSF